MNNMNYKGLAFKDVDGWKPQKFTNITYSNFFESLKNICISSFEWSGLPEGTNERYMETCNLFTGKFAFFYDEILEQYLTLPFVCANKLNVYNEPDTIEVYGMNGYRRMLTREEYEPCFNNYSMTGDIPLLNMVCTRMTTLKRTMDININAQKTPVLMLGDKSQMLMLKNLYKKFDESNPVIFGSSDFNFTENFKVFKTDAPFTSDKMQALLHSELNDFLSLRGIENSNQDKKERLVADEVSSNYGLVEAARNVYLQPREDFCKRVKEHFDIDLKVRFKSNIITTVNSPNLLGTPFTQIENVDNLEESEGIENE